MSPKKIPTPQDYIDRMEDAAESERLRVDYIDILADEPFSRFEDWAASMETISSSIESAKDALEAWRDEEDREAKADARETAIDALRDLVSAWNDSPLDLSSLKEG